MYGAIVFFFYTPCPITSLLVFQYVCVCPVGVKVRAVLYVYCCLAPMIARSCAAACIGVAMGVRDLWKVLSKAKRKVDIKELRGKTLAVDLSCWICQFSSVKGMFLCMYCLCMSALMI